MRTTAPQRLRYADDWPPRRSKESQQAYVSRSRQWQQWAEQDRPCTKWVGESDYREWRTWAAALVDA